jgi:NAD/NADP transhydrogenase alpha subunit
VLLGMLQPWGSAERACQLAERRITSFALELLPRISRAQSMDALSSAGCGGRLRVRADRRRPVARSSSRC